MKFSSHLLFRLIVSVILSASTVNVFAADSTNDYAVVHSIFLKHCMDCHGADDPEGNLVLETFETLMKGGESGAAIVPGKSSDSLLVKMIEGNIVKDGKKKIMPPGKAKKLGSSEIAAVKAWIDAGAMAPTEIQILVKELVVPKIVPKNPRKAIQALASSPDTTLIAAANYGDVELRSSENGALIRTLSGHRGKVNAVAFSADGSHLFAASGENALSGEVKQWTIPDGTLVRTFEGHKDTLYSVAISPDGKILATGSYDQKIKLWDVASGKEIKTLSGHNGAVFDLAFRPDGKILASASGDRTVKLWDVSKGERRDTLSQPLKDVLTVAFGADGKKLYAGGADNRIRVWEISETAMETTNPILVSQFAHEGTILQLVFSPDGKWLLSSADDRTVKLWDGVSLKEKMILEKQPDWATGLAFGLQNQRIIVGRLDGSLGVYERATGKLMSSNTAPQSLAPQQAARK